jgi:hypothetical protein
VNRSTVVIALTLVLSVNAFAPPSFADAYDAAMARAVAAKEKAVDSNDPGAWDEALRLFEEADAIKPTKDSKYELAGAAARLKEDDVAVEAYEEAIKLGLSGKAKEKAEGFVKQHAASMGRLDVKGPAGTTLAIGARKRGTLPRGPLVVFAGNVQLRATSNGVMIDESIPVKEGATQSIDLTPKFAPKPAPTATATAAPTTAPATAPTGAQTVPLSDAGAGARTLGWSLMVAGGVIVVVAGAGLIVSSGGLSSRRDSLAEHCSIFKVGDTDQCKTPKTGQEAAAQSDNDAIATWKGVRTASFITGGVGLMIFGVGVVRLLTAPKPQQASAWQPVVTVGANGAYFGLSGSF